MFINVCQRPHTVGVFVGADARTSVPTVRGGLLHALHIIRLFMLARPAQGAATTVDIRCLSSVADARTSVPTVRGWIIACVTYYSLVRCLRGRHKARPLQWIFVDCPLLADARTSVPTGGCGLLQSRGRPIVPVSSGRGAARCPFICTHPTKSNHTQPVGTHVRASTPNHRQL